ncbi:MAG: phosphoribosylformylglycinamidine synthase subunit PurQ [Calditrichaceae bacterium]|jgi:phosphoribosylformylglycinamidine synthase subunit PurQ / glutaminase
MKTVKSLVVTGFGINCEEEMAAANRLAGADADIVHLSDVFNERINIHDYDILNFPGGFSFGDDLGAAKVLGNKFKFKKMASGRFFMDELKRFLDEGKFMIGVCNGFQALVKMGFLPNSGGNFEQEATITYNASGKFEDRWVTCGVNRQSKTPFLNEIKIIDLPVRHGEGKILFKDDAIRRAVTDHKLNCMSYLDEQGNATDKYPMNPNGSELNCAGLCDPSGQVFGLMPHPEAFTSNYNHPNWGKLKRQNPNMEEKGDGLKIFMNIVNHIIK